jgi:uncharacterized repeat protein (TIGR03803 family)
LNHDAAGWVLSPLYNFPNGALDGSEGSSALTVGVSGLLYGAAPAGGGNCDPNSCGVVFQLQPAAAVCSSTLCFWKQTRLHIFDGADGSGPAGSPVFDQQGNLFGTTTGDPFYGSGNVYELSRHDAWRETVLYSFQGGGDGSHPISNVTFDSGGNIYGTTEEGGTQSCQYGCGVVYELRPSGSGWTEQVLYSFQGGSDGEYPVGGVIFDSAGNLYGTTSSGGANGGGTVFELSPSNGSWVITTLYSFSGQEGSLANLTMDASGNLYGTTTADGAYSQGSVFKLTRANGGWTYSSLYDFTGGSDGGQPSFSGVTFDAVGNLYGTAALGGMQQSSCGFGGYSGCGVAWEITP